MNFDGVGRVTGGAILHALGNHVKIEVNTLLLHALADVDADGVTGFLLRGSELAFISALFGCAEVHSHQPGRKRGDHRSLHLEYLSFVLSAQEPRSSLPSQSE